MSLNWKQNVPVRTQMEIKRMRIRQKTLPKKWYVYVLSLVSFCIHTAVLLETVGI